MNPLGTLFAVVMVGHSLFGTDGPDMLQEALRAGQGEGTVTAQIINGAPLKYNWEHSDEAQGVDARAVLPEGATTHLILTEAIPLANHTKWSDTEVYAQAFFGLAVSANPSSKVYIQETWHSLNSGTGVGVAQHDNGNIPWRTRLTQDLPVWEGIVAAVAAGNRAPEAGIALIPAGQAMGRLSDEIAAGRIEGLEEISALFSDDIHLNHLGHYFVAMVQYATLTGQNPLGLPEQFNDRYGQPFDAPSEDLARALQRVAWDAVQAYDGIAVMPVPPALISAAPTATTGPPAAAVAPVGAGTPVPGTSDVAIGLAAVEDWSVQQPFIDVMKTARPWIGHVAGRFGGMEYEELLEGDFLDEDGWPLRMPRNLGSIGTLILTDLPESAVSLAGRYRLSFAGTGVVEVAGRATNVRYGTGEVTFDYEPGPGAVDIRIQRINTTDPVRDIRVVKFDNIERFERGDLFNPDWTRRIGQFEALRFMDWMDTNDSTLSDWADRPRQDDFTYALNGVPVEVLVRLANELEIDVWFTMPHLADDAYVLSFAEYVAGNLDPTLKAYVEFSNEVWNWQFAQARWADAQAMARWDTKDAWVQYYALRAMQVMDIWTEVFGDSADARLVRVISSQTGWLGLEADILDGPLWRAEAAGNEAPAEAFDAYAVTGYFGGVLGLEDRDDMVKGWLADSRARAEVAATDAGLKGAEADAYIQEHRFDHATTMAAQELRDGGVSGNAVDSVADLIGRVWPYHAAVARARGLDLIMYEGGTHIVGVGPQVDDAELTAFFHHLNYSAEMGDLYTTLMQGWRDIGGQLFNAYSDVYNPVKWGSWGALRSLSDENPRWDALVSFE